jgi:hypothetical protein
MAKPSTSLSPAASTNFQLVFPYDSESSGYFRFKPASSSQDKKLSIECKVMLKKMPPTNATVFKIQEYELFDTPSSSTSSKYGRQTKMFHFAQVSPIFSIDFF